MIERRNYPRVEVAYPVHYHSDIYERPRTGSTLDLSFGGARIETPYKLTPGERLNISISVPANVIECEAMVVHVWRFMSERLRMGVRFEEMSKQDRGHLAECIAHVMEKPEERNPVIGLLIGLGLSFLIWAAIIYAILILI